MREKRNRKVDFNRKKSSSSSKKRQSREINKNDFRKEEKRPKKYISKKRRRRRARILLAFAIVIIVGGTLTALSLTVFFPIKNINVVDNKKYSAEQIISSIGVVKGDNLLLASDSRATKAVKENLPFIKSVDFNKKLPFTLEVKVNEYTVYSQIKYNDKYIVVGDDGLVLEVSDKFTKNSTEVRGVTPKTESIGEKISFKEDEKETILQKTNKIISAFQEKDFGRITLINYENMHDIRVTYSNRIVMLLGSDSYLEQKLTHAQAVLTSRNNTGETGTLNLSRIPSTKNEASFIPRELEKSEIAGK